MMIKAVVTIESSELTYANQGFNLDCGVHSKSSPLAGEEHQDSPEDSIALPDREQLRRMRISKANKGNTPWNKGRKHTPETLQRIKERTRIAMQDPKVKMKLVKVGHAQSEETRIKIGVGVRIGWEKRREKLLLQETCVYDWQNLIAENGRKGLLGEEELQWDSYKILDKQLVEEWTQSVEERKKMRRPKGSKRAPKSIEQRRKISEAIAAKWADPEYRTRVYSGLAKFHGIVEGVERKPRKKPTSRGETRRSNPEKKKVDRDDSSSPKPDPKSQKQRGKLERNKPVYKDPLVGSKLEMLKNIRAQRAAAERQKNEAITRAKVLIAEAETAAKVLEEAAKKSPVAQACLLEARKLIAEAIESITSIDKGQVDPQSCGNSSLSSADLISSADDEMNVELEEFKGSAQMNSMAPSKINGFEKCFSEHLLEEKGPVQPSSFGSHNLLNGKENLHQMRAGDYVPPLVLDDATKLPSFTEQLGEIVQNGGLGHAKSTLFNGVHSNAEGRTANTGARTKKWVRGKLVEVTEEC